jgi:23S rRNA (guanosine2251-2'-O)-methyltransferase
MSDLIVGRRAVLESLRANRRRHMRLWVEGDAPHAASGAIAEILEIAAQRNLPTRYVKGGLFDKLSNDQANHQGVALESGDYPYVPLHEALRIPQQRGEMPFLLILDHLQDPQNVGTLIRTAEAMGVHAIIMPDRRAARVTPAVSNASAGAVEHMAVAQVTNLNQTIRQLKEDGVWIAGLEEDPAAVDLGSADLSGPLAIVVGSEGEGISRLTRESCDFLLRVPMSGEIQSLNASVAGSIALYLARQSRASV